MNINPSFGRIVQLQGSKSQALNIASLVNSPVKDKTHTAIQNDARRIFKDASSNEPVRVITRNNGKDVYLFSGKDSALASTIIEGARDSLEQAKLFTKDSAQFQLVVKGTNEETNLAINKLIEARKSPKTIVVAEYRGQQRIGVINFKA